MFYLSKGSYALINYINLEIELKRHLQAILLKLLMLILIACFISCSMSPHKMPVNYVDAPAILPKGTNKFNIHHSPVLHERQEFDTRIIRRIVPAIIPSGSYNKNLEYPIIYMPYVTILIGKNDYYEIGRIKYNKFHHLIFGGLNGFSYSQLEGWGMSWGIGYKNIYVNQGKYRIESSVSFENDQFSSQDNTWIRLASIGYVKMGKKLSPFASVRITTGNFESNISDLIFQSINEGITLGGIYFLNPFIGIEGNYFFDFYQSDKAVYYHKSGPKNYLIKNSWGINISFYL